MDEGNEWLKKMPVMSYPVSLCRFEELINFLYNYGDPNYGDLNSSGPDNGGPNCGGAGHASIAGDDLLCKILFSLGFITSAKYKDAEVTPAGSACFTKSDGRIFANEQGQALLKQYLLTNGFAVPVPVPEPGRKPEILPFSITEEQAEGYEFSDEPVSLAQIVLKINALIDTARYKKLTSTAVADFLVDEGLLAVIPVEGGKFYRRATKKGNVEGIFYKDFRAGDGNTYLVNIYDKNAQFFIIDNLPVITLFARGEKKVRESRLNEVPGEAPVAKSAAKHTCRDCMDYRNGNCFGADKVCEDFRFAPTFSSKETENWPTEGTASYLRRTGRRRR